MRAEKLGADAALLVAPYYNKPSQEGLYRHYRAIAEAVRIPIVLYSIPGRCGIEIGVETVARLANDSRTSWASRNPGAPWSGSASFGTRCPSGFEILSGDDSLTLPFLSAGGVGVISVASNLIPRASVGLRARLAGRADSGRRSRPRTGVTIRCSRICS